MKKILLLITVIWSVAFVNAQDISFYHRNLNDEFVMPRLEWGFSHSEFQLLSRDVRLMDWFYGAVVPGYVHFRAKDNKTGYGLLAARMTGYAGIAYVLYDSQSSLADIFQGEFGNTDKSNTYKYISEISLVLIFSSYLFDMIHGNYRMKRKQELIRFKYGTKMNYAAGNSPLTMRFDPPQTPLFGVTMTF